MAHKLIIDGSGHSLIIDGVSHEFSIDGGLTLTPSDTINMSDSRIVNLGKPFADTISLSDTIIKSAGTSAIGRLILLGVGR